jgi:PBSX family phage terminase large subunit
MTVKRIKLSNVIASHFANVHLDCKMHAHTHYWLKGGRGSTKSSFISLELLLLMIKNPSCHAVVLRKVGNTIRHSTFSQVGWAIDVLGLTSKFKITQSPPEITYKKTGQKILFMGVDDKSKIKSLKLPFGYVGIVWYEELDQFSGMNEIRNINQSLLRGGAIYWCFYSYNPPKSRDNWVNTELLNDDIGRLVDHSNYLQVPAEWLGAQFILEAEKLRRQRPDLYAHEYLGEVTGIGGDVFGNVEELSMDNRMIESFDNIRNGMDFGFATDPFAYNKMQYDSKHDAIYIFDEVYGRQLTNKKAYGLIRDKIGNKYVYADSAEPKSIRDFCDLGLHCLPVKKGADSRDFGIKWLSDRAHIYIDKQRCPNTYREFVNYQFSQDKDGNFISQYPKNNDHSIDAVRYALKQDMRGDTFSFT